MSMKYLFALLFFASAAGAAAQDSLRAIALDTTHIAGVCYRPACRSTTQRDRFVRLTGYNPRTTGGPRPGWVVDHMKPLECGGADLPSNMMWQTVEEAKAKDRTEKQCGRWAP